MHSLKPETSISEYQDFVRKVYGKPNDLHYDLHDMLNNVHRFAMRGLKGIRKSDKEKTRINIIISMSWFMSTLNRLHINLEDAVWRRFPFLCSYCASCPCSCKEIKTDERKNVPVDDSKKPASLEGFQRMFEEIYPPESRTLDYAGVHLAEEIGEFSEALLAYRGEHKSEYLENIYLEAADAFSCFVGVFNSLKLNLAQELSGMFAENCHQCKKAPCECTFSSVMSYKS
jgi:NTP pyrophosphatase (non-canonical NTP hydrolase)